MSKYKLSDHAPIQAIEVVENGILIMKNVKGIYPFGPQCKIITDKNLTDSMAEFLLAKVDEGGNKIYDKLIVKSK